MYIFYMIWYAHVVLVDVFLGGVALVLLYFYPDCNPILQVYPKQDTFGWQQQHPRPK